MRSKVRGREDQVGQDVIKRRAGGVAARAAFQFGVERDAARGQDRDHDFREPAPADVRGLESRERRALRAFEPDRRHQRLGFLGDHRRAVIDLHQRAGDGDAPFREDDQPLVA